MAKDKWWEDPAEFYRRWEDSGRNQSVMHIKHNVGVSTITRWMRKHEAAGMMGADLPPLVPIEAEHITLAGDFGVSSDWHSPLTKYEVLYRFLDDTRNAGIKRIICAGDLTNQDALAGHEDKQPGAEMEPEMQHLHHAVSLALDAVDELIITFGNHDRHAASKLKVDFDRSIRMLLCDLPPDKIARIRVTARDAVTVETERGPWLICHTRSYSRLPLNYPNRLALRHGMHVAAGHRHHHAQGKAANGKDIVELGGLHDSARMTYANKYTNDLPEMANGYGILVDGFMRCPMLYS